MFLGQADPAGIRAQNYIVQDGGRRRRRHVITKIKSLWPSSVLSGVEGIDPDFRCFNLPKRRPVFS